MDFRWHVARTHPGLERTASENLRAQAIETFHPYTVEKRVVGGRAVDAKVNLFPGYIFVWADRALGANQASWAAISSTRGIVRMLPSHIEVPSPLPRGFVEDLQARFEAGTLSAAEAGVVVDRYRPREIVPIVAGAFAGHAGMLVKYHKGSLQLLVALLGGEVRVEVPQHQVAVRSDASHGQISAVKPKAPQFNATARRKWRSAEASVR